MQVITQEYLSDLENIAKLYTALKTQHTQLIDALRLRGVTALLSGDGYNEWWEVILPPQYMADAKLESLLSALKVNGIQGRWDDALGKWNLKLPGDSAWSAPTCDCLVCQSVRAIPFKPASDDQHVRLHVDDLIKLITRGTVPAPAKA